MVQEEVTRISLESIAVIGRSNPHAPGGSPFSAFGTGVSIHPDGVALTCWHNLESFLRTWSLFDLGELYREGFTATPDEMQRHESPRAQLLKPFPPDGAYHAFPMVGGLAERRRDLALMELGGRGRFRPLPHMQLGTQPPEPGSQLGFIGISHPPGTPHDSLGMPGGMAIRCDKMEVLGLDETYVYLDYVFEKGNSGGPLFHPESMEVVAVAVGTVPAAEVPVSRKAESAVVSRAALVGDVPRMLEELKEQAARRHAAGGLSWCGLVEAAG